MIDNGLDLAPIEARYAATTRHKWILYSVGGLYYSIGLDEYMRVCNVPYDLGTSEDKANAEFIVAAHNEDIPALIAEVRRVRLLLELSAEAVLIAKCVEALARSGQTYQISYDERDAPMLWGILTIPDNYGNDRVLAAGATLCDALTAFAKQEIGDTMEPKS